MDGGKNKNAAKQKVPELGTSLSGGSPERPPADAPDGQKINKLKATVVWGVDTWLLIVRCRSACPRCGPRLESLSWLDR
jgi:hypothetical protein